MRKRVIFAVSVSILSAVILIFATTLSRQFRSGRQNGRQSSAQGEERKLLDVGCRATSGGIACNRLKYDAKSKDRSCG